MKKSSFDNCKINTVNIGLGNVDLVQSSINE
jgi:hypothetical protein